MNEKQRKVLELLKQEGGNVSSYMVVQLCDLYRDTSLTLAVLTQDRYIKSITTRYGVSYRITDKGRSELALSQRAEMVSEVTPAPTHEETVWLSEVLEQIEAAGAWDDGAALRVVIIEAFGLTGLQMIEQYGRRIPVVDTWPGDAWIYAGPFSTAREYRRRKNEIRALYRG